MCIKGPTMKTPQQCKARPPSRPVPAFYCGLRSAASSASVTSAMGSIQLNSNRLFNGVLIVLQDVPQYYKNSVARSVEIQLNCLPCPLGLEHAIWVAMSPKSQLKLQNVTRAQSTLRLSNLCEYTYLIKLQLILIWQVLYSHGNKAWILVLQRVG